VKFGFHNWRLSRIHDRVLARERCSVIADHDEHLSTVVFHSRNERSNRSAHEQIGSAL
jgi:hypothetical protein